MATAVLAALLLAGCGNGVQATDARRASDAPLTAYASEAEPSAEPSGDYVGVAGDLAKSVPAVAAACPALRAKRLPENPPADQIFFCTMATRPVAGDGEWMFAQVRRVTGGVEKLFAAYAHRDARLGQGACKADLPDPRVVWLHTEPIRMVHAPRDKCGKPTDVAREAFDSLTTEIVADVRMRQVQSQQSIDTGCSQQWKDMLSELARDSTAAPSGAPSPMPAGPAKVCRYTVQVDAQGSRVGELVSAQQLDAERVQAINTALAAARPDATCRRDEHHSFAVVTISTGGDELYAALDGCAVQQGNKWWRAGDDLRDLLR